MRKDDKLMALLSVWGIILVVMGHSGFTSDIIAPKLSGLHTWIYSFHMPLFFFISGYLYSLTNKDFMSINKQKFILKKISRLLIPYFVLGCVVFLIKYAFAGLSSASRTFGIESFLYMFVAPQSTNSTMGYLWYVITLFNIFLIACCLSAIRINLKSQSISIIVVLFFWIISYIIPHTEILNLNNVLWYFPFFCFGIIFQVAGLKNKLFVLRYNTLVASVLAGGGIHLILLFILPAYLPLGIRRIITAVIGCAVSICLCQLIIRAHTASKCLFKLAPYSYSIYLLSWFGQYPVQILTINVLELNWFLDFILIFIAGIIFPVFVHNLIRKIFPENKAEFLKLTIGY